VVGQIELGAELRTGHVRQLELRLRTLAAAACGERANGERERNEA
jgi:hypothetical protein